ncbi:unnamed protein product [Nezara viridula]|uniref:Sex-determining region Y protein n=1 Tax=Nezara viridula TaxID=85310 RepID=A0A9P0E2N8_NEZVI|nr:unnamed protein product [Nezara viridula]
MIYANTWRKKLAHDHPSESNKQISVRLGKLWKDMAADEKELYFALARRVDAEHKKKYPEPSGGIEGEDCEEGEQKGGGGIDEEAAGADPPKSSLLPFDKGLEQ